MAKTLNTDVKEDQEDFDLDEDEITRIAEAH